LVGEVEHWTQIRVQPGLPKTLDTPVTAELLQAEGSFCHSKAYGFLTSHPGYAGSGLQIECGLHLPALTALLRMPQIQQALNAMGFELHPLSVHIPGTAESGFFRIASRGGMEFPKENLYHRFVEKVKSVLAVEKEALEQWQEREKKRLEERIYRSLRSLQDARTLDYSEFQTFLSFARVGVYLRYFPGKLLSCLEELRVRLQPFHMGAMRSGMKANEADIFRANVVRSELEGFGL
jgi:protein arginine kinase